jgi:hypothetical protein
VILLLEFEFAIEPETTMAPRAVIWPMISGVVSLHGKGAVIALATENVPVIVVESALVYAVKRPRAAEEDGMKFGTSMVDTRADHSTPPHTGADVVPGRSMKVGYSTESADYDESLTRIDYAAGHWDD